EVALPASLRYRAPEMASESQPSYDFEDHSYRGLEDARRYRKLFLQRLDAKVPDDADAIEKLFLDFATDIHLNIAWYKRALQKERGVWRSLRGLPLGLTVLPPVGFFGAAGPGDATPPSQITAVLTGLFALYRVVVAAFVRRERF